MDQRAACEDLIAERGEAWVVEHWGLLEAQREYIDATIGDLRFEPKMTRDAPSEAKFCCGTCSNPAGVVAFVRAGEPVPGEFRGRALIDDVSDRNRLLTLDPVGESTDYLAEVGNLTLSEIARALQTRDAQALYQLSPYYVPFWCPTCRAAYCSDHWVKRTAYDDGFYDCTYGTCPAGHERVLDD